MKAFITGTDTGVGKTFFTVLLTRALRKLGRDTIALKPVCCGDREDAIALQEAGGAELTLQEVNPLYFEAPLAPLLAAFEAGETIQPESLVAAIQRVSSRRRSVLVEGAGGWLVPIAPNFTMADLAGQLGFPVLLVVANRLGCINHTLLTLSDLQSRGLACDGLVINSRLPLDESSRTNPNALEELTGLPILWELTQDQSELAVPEEILWT